jgi:hypothetical protein
MHESNPVNALLQLPTFSRPDHPDQAFSRVNSLLKRSASSRANQQLKSIIPLRKHLTLNEIHDHAININYHKSDRDRSVSIALSGEFLIARKPSPGRAFKSHEGIWRSSDRQKGKQLLGESRFISAKLSALFSTRR